MKWQSWVIDSTTVSNWISFYKQQRLRWLWIIHYNMEYPLTTWDGYEVVANDKRWENLHHTAIFLCIKIAVFILSCLFSKDIYSNKSWHKYYKLHCSFCISQQISALAWLNIGLCMHNTDTQCREIWISHLGLYSLFHCFLADRLSAYATEHSWEWISTYFIWASIIWSFIFQTSSPNQCTDSYQYYSSKYVRFHFPYSRTEKCKRNIFLSCDLFMIKMSILFTTEYVVWNLYECGYNNVGKNT